MSESCMCDECVAWRKRLMKAELARERSTTPPTEPARRVSDEVIDLALDDLKAIGDEGSKLDRWQERERDGWLDLRDERAARAQDAATIEALRAESEHRRQLIEELKHIVKGWQSKAESAEARLAAQEKIIKIARCLADEPADSPEGRNAMDDLVEAMADYDETLAALSAKRGERG